MANPRAHYKTIGRSFMLTTVFCLLIAVITRLIWSGSWGEHIAISIGYGYSAVLSAHTLGWLFPNLPMRHINAYSVSSAMVIGTANAYFWLHQYDSFSQLSDLKPVVLLGFIFTFACFFYFYAHEQKLIAEKQLEVAKREQADQEKALVLSQLNQLQSQIEPHFLFNTLANISVLIETDPRAAKQMLEKLTDLLRATLNKSRRNLVSLKDELDLVEAYLGIQKMRLSERLSYKIEAEGDFSQVLLPPLLLQPLVENAVQHGIEPSSVPGQITIRINSDPEAFNLEVRDTGVGFNGGYGSKGNGLGLDNIRQRLKTLFDGQAQFVLKEGPESGVISQITISAQALDKLNQSNNGN